MSDNERIVWFELGIERKMEKAVGWRTGWGKKKIFRKIMEGERQEEKRKKIRRYK